MELISDKGSPPWEKKSFQSTLMKKKVVIDSDFYTRGFNVSLLI